MKKFIIYVTVAVALLCSLSSCYKKYEWSLPLAVNSTALTLPTTGNGYFYMPVYSSVQWEINIQYEEGNKTEWLHPDITSGKGEYTNIKFNYDRNYMDEPRQAIVHILPLENVDSVNPIDVVLTQKAGN